MARFCSSDFASADGAHAMAGDLAGLLTTAEALARGGRTIDLGGLDDLAGRLCAAALDLPAEQGRAMRPVLLDLAARMERLQGVLDSGAGG